MAEKFALAATREERQKILFAAKSWAAEKVNNKYRVFTNKCGMFECS